MSSAMVAVAIVAVLVALTAVLLLSWPMLRTRRLRKRFGPEYDRAVEQRDDRRAAERELRERELRHAGLELRDLSEDQRKQYTARWADVQERFVDDPAAALSDADRLVTSVMSDRGYPAESYDQQLADLSVEHAPALGHYRSAHAIATRTNGETTTEDMRTAIVHYRELFHDLIDGRTRQTKDALS
ncbi:hypothetical protein [Nocardia bhagyanarayanae]|uniref:Secreted protein n=1 Tax=Nocardia bhagyanarayanae TaxID=1215925 RepID=A0A543FA77_9NOCA|nr:hypothetical protein [Nocardia bhagyanarayanae]TQM30715.1 hypothetical protein FB390_2351 [Nocardia bhagyanarayanae]